MSCIQAFFGESCHQYIDHLKPQEGWQILSRDWVTLAFLSEARIDIGEQSSLFSSPDGKCIGVFAGKIFGFRQLVNAFPANLNHAQRMGLLFQRLYTEYDVNFPNALEGFFSVIMAIDGKLFAARDAIGERPLYVMSSFRETMIANQMSALVHHPKCVRNMHPGAISDFLSTGFMPFARTPVGQISKIFPGSTFEVNDTGVETYTYHELPNHDHSIPEQQCIKQIRNALTHAVTNRLEPGKKTALLLSGGLDSSLVGALVGGENLVAAYSLTFGEHYRNELEYSGLMARALGIPARIITVTPLMIKQNFLKTATILDEPIGDPLTIPNIIIAEEAAKEAQIVFNGEGGDPVFGGPKNLPIMAFEAYANGIQEISREEIYLQSYNKGHEHQKTILTADFLQETIHHPTTAELLAPYLYSTNMDSYLDRLMYLNLRLKGAAQILPKVFKASSAAGLAVRSPLFDRRLVEQALAMPSPMKLKGAVEKFVLKKAVADIVPESIISRPKSGMLVPVHFWFRNELQSFASEVLLDSGARTRYFVDRKAVSNLLQFKGSGVRPHYGQRIWLLLSLEFWMQAYGISDTF
ncbi:MAG: asparagine synthetase B family protein [Methylococcaceae bacterium]